MSGKNPSEICPDGFTMMFWFKMRRGSNDDQIEVIASPFDKNGVSIAVKVKSVDMVKVNVRIRTHTQKWSCLYEGVPYPVRWMLLTLQWLPDGDCSLFVDSQLVATNDGEYLHFRHNIAMVSNYFDLTKIQQCHDNILESCTKNILKYQFKS